MELYQPVSPLRALTGSASISAILRPPNFDNLLRARISWIQPVPGLPPTSPPHPSTPLPARTSQLPARITGLPLQASPQLVLPIRPYYQPVLPARITGLPLLNLHISTSPMARITGWIQPVRVHVGCYILRAVTGWYYGLVLRVFFHLFFPSPHSTPTLPGNSP